MAEYKKLLNESFINDVTTSKDEDGKTLYIEGVFMGAEKKNRNGRIYPHALIEREVNRFNEYIKNNEALGELEHPADRAKVDPREAAIKIISLKMDEDFAIGKAKVLEYMPNGKMLAGLLQDVRMGVSSRGVGDVNEDTGIVESNFQLITIDSVLGPSCPDAFVNAVRESYEWVLNESTGLYIEKRIQHTPEEAIKTLEPAKEAFDKKLDAKGSKAVVEAFREFMDVYKHI
jgi:hypothetical protein